MFINRRQFITGVAAANSLYLLPRIAGRHSVAAAEQAPTSTAPAASRAAELVAPGGGRQLWVLGTLVTFKASSEDTGGSCSVFELYVPPAAGTPLHVHAREEETFFILAGELDMTVGDKTVRAVRGSFIALPRGVPHRLANSSKRAARALVTCAPAGFEKWLLETGKPVSGAELIPPQLAEQEIQEALAKAERYGLTFPKPQ